MLGIYCAINWFNLTDEACEGMLYDTSAFRQFCGVDLGKQGLANAATLLTFRHMLAGPSFIKNQDKAS